MVKTGTSPGTWYPATTGEVSNLDFYGADQPNAAANYYILYPVRLPSSGEDYTYSYERYVTIRARGSYTRINNVRFWMASYSFPSGVTLRGNRIETAASYQTPLGVTTTSAMYSVASAMYTSWDAEGSAEILNNNAGTEDITGSGSYGNFMKMQLWCDTNASTTDAMANMTFYIKYDEV